MSTNPYEAPRAELNEVPSNQAPAIWNPRVAANWSLLFSPVFGAILHTMNWRALGEPERAKVSRMWAIGCVVFLLLSIFSPFVFGDSAGADLMERAAGLGLLIVWYTTNGRSQMRYVEERYGNSYPHKGWGKPITFAILVIFGFLIVAFLIGMSTALTGALHD